MSLAPAFKIGLGNAWMFMIVFLLQMLAMRLVDGCLIAFTKRP